MSRGRPDVPLVVDLDGTFFRGDTLQHMAIRLALRRPQRIPGAILSLRRGRASLKSHLWMHSGLRVGDLRVSARLGEWLDGQAAAGRPIHLATGAPQPLADAVAREWPLFTDAMGTSPGRT